MVYLPLPSAISVGVKQRIAKIVYLSGGTSYELTNRFRFYEAKLAKTKKIKFSSNWKKQQQKIGQLHHKIAQVRKYRLYWLLNEISKNHTMIVLKGLNLANMSKSAKGTMDVAGKNVKVKVGLNKAILGVCLVATKIALAMWVK